MASKNVTRAWYMLYLTYGIVPIVAGLDKYFHYIVNWNMYVSPLVTSIIPLSVKHFLYAVGGIEIFAGLLVLAQPIIGGSVVAAWLMLVVVNLLSMGMFFDIAIRDVALAIGAYALVLLSRDVEASKPSFISK